MKPRLDFYHRDTKKVTCDFSIQNPINKKRGWKEKRLFCTDEEFLKIQIQLDKDRKELINKQGE